MAKQPSYRPLEPSEFFADGQSARPLPAGTVARGKLPWRQTEFLKPADDRPAPADKGQTPSDYVNEFPFPVTRDVLHRGRERFSIYCAVCHGATGRGDGKIVERGYTRPPSFITDRSRGMKHHGIDIPLREMPAGYYFEVITKGYGAMPDYATEVDPDDRWNIIAYIRALQLSQHARLADLPEALRQAAAIALENAHEHSGKR